MEEKKQRFIPMLINTVKYTKKVKVADIKQYLMDEYKLTNNLVKENKELRKDLEKSKITEEKYNVALITLDEYKRRLNDKDKDIKELNDMVSKNNDTVSKLKAKITDLEVKASDISLRVDKIKTEAIKEYKKELLNAISELRGNISKTKITELIKK